MHDTSRKRRRPRAPIERVDSEASFARLEKTPPALVKTVLMELLAQSLAQQAANRDDVSEFVEMAANELQDLALHAFAMRR